MIFISLILPLIFLIKMINFSRYFRAIFKEIHRVARVNVTTLLYAEFCGHGKTFHGFPWLGVPFFFKFGKKMEFYKLKEYVISHAISFDLIKKPLNSVYFRTGMCSPGIPFISELKKKKTRQVIPSHGQSCHFRGIPLTKGGGYIYTHNSV